MIMGYPHALTPKGTILMGILAQICRLKQIQSQYKPEQYKFEEITQEIAQLNVKFDQIDCESERV